LGFLVLTSGEVDTFSSKEVPTLMRFIPSVLLVQVAFFVHCASSFAPPAPLVASRLSISPGVLSSHKASNPSFGRPFSLLAAEKQHFLPAVSMSASSAAENESFDGAECKGKTCDRFRGQNVLLTGASGGLGRAIAIQLSRIGVGTLILSGRDEAALKQVADECRAVIPSKASGDGASSFNIEVIPCDLSNTDSVKSLGECSLKVCSPGCVDILINNGGISSRSSFLETKAEVDELLMQVNFLSGSRLAKMLVPGMVDKGGGSIIWVSSVQGLVGIPSRTSYAASKFAVQGYCEALRAELASSGVTVHVASPGYIKTNLSKSAIRGDGSKHGKMDDTTANGADPNDVAVTILDSAADGIKDFVVAAGFSAKAAIWLRLLAPSFLSGMLVKRFDKEKSSS